MIIDLDSPSCRVKQVDEVKKSAKEFFETTYIEPHGNRPLLEGVPFKELSLKERHSLTKSFNLKEVKEVIWFSASDRSAGPDEFNTTFFKGCWEVRKVDLLKFVNEFYTKGKTPRAVTSSFLDLIPKSGNPQRLEDFRPISLISSLYKILSKLLALRLKRVIPNLISRCQSDFPSQRHI